MKSISEYQSISAPPSVSNEQWKKHALKKMASGYLLIIGDTRNIANFYKGNGELESCSYRTAIRLLREEYLEEAGAHITGTIYTLSDKYKNETVLSKITRTQLGALKKISNTEPDDEFEDMSDDLSDDIFSTEDVEDDQDAAVS